MNKIVSLAEFRKQPPPELPATTTPPDKVLDFIRHELYDWAEKNKVDMSTMKFKYEAATIMSVLQGMTHE